jgi:hypothetical protein
MIAVLVPTTAMKAVTHLTEHKLSGKAREDRVQVQGDKGRRKIMGEN